MRRICAILAIVTTALSLGGCASRPETLEELLQQVEAAHQGLETSTYGSSDELTVSIDVGHMEDADAALASAVIDEIDERIDRASLGMPERWTYRIGFALMDRTASVIRLWSDTDRELRTAVLEVVPAAGCSTDNGREYISVSCVWREATQATGVRDAAALLARLPTELSPFTLKASFDNSRSLVRAFEGFTDEHIVLLEAAADMFAAAPQRQVSITLSSPTFPFGAFDEDARISVLDPDASIAPALQTIIDESPLWVRADIGDGSAIVSELVDASP
jgi:hypothetical protein